MGINDDYQMEEGWLDDTARLFEAAAMDCINRLREQQANDMINAIRRDFERKVFADADREDVERLLSSLESEQPEE